MFMLRLILVSALTFATPLAFSQENEEPQKAVGQPDQVDESVSDDRSEERSTNQKQYERVQVTGSLIRRADFEGPSPVEVIDRKSIEESSHNSVADVLREMPISSSGATRETSGASASGAATVNLRGLGASNTLVLLNGNRMQIDGVLGAVNMNLIPEIAIENVDILKDGASATYGSDAIGGVVSIQTRKDFSGTEVSSKISITEEEGGERFDFGVIHGDQFTLGDSMRGSVTAALQYRKNRRIYARDRRFTAARNDGRFTTGWTDIGPVPNYKTDSGNVTYLDRQCPNSGKDTGDGNRFCPYAFAEESTTLPEIEQTSIYLNSTLDIDSRNSISFTGIGTQQTNSWQFAPSPGTFPLGLEIPASQSGTINQGGPLPGATGDVPFTYRTEALGNRITEGTNDSFNLGAEYVREFGQTWRWRNFVGYNTSKRVNRYPSGYALFQPFINLINSGAFNPFAENPDFSVFDSVRYQPSNTTQSTTTSANSILDGELFSWGNNVLSGAFGAQYINMSYETTSDERTLANEVFGNAGSEGDGRREIYATFSELGLTLGKKWEIQLAARYDKFSDFGDAFSPKFGVKYRPLNTLMFRASVGKAFKAPLMTQLYAGTSIGSPTFRDVVKCNREIANNNPGHPACSGRQERVRLEANSNLDAEEATSFNFGAVLEPIRDFSIVLDYWMIDQTSIVGLDLEALTRAESRGVDLSQYNVTVSRDATDNLELITAQRQNLTSRIQSGLDFGLNYRFSNSLGRFSLANNYGYIFNREVEGFPGAGNIDENGWAGQPEWRNSLSLTYSPIRDHAITLAANSTASTLDEGRDGRFKTFTQLDLSYNTTTLWKGSVLTVGVKNLLNEVPPFDPDVQGDSFRSALYPVLQRYAYLGLRQRF